MNVVSPKITYNETIITEFSVPDIRCAGCISKLEKGLILDPDIDIARVNFTAKRVKLTHRPDAKLNDMVGAFSLLGFEAYPIGDGPENAVKEDSRELLRALGVAGFAMMNIMLLSVAVWSGADGITRDLFHWVSALIALPTIAYSGRPFFRSAWRALRHRQTNMDVPISIGVTLTAALSLYETMMGGTHAYFDGAVMLLFFLLSGRWLDSVMRDRARDGVTALLKNMGTGAVIMAPDGRTKWTPTHDIKPGMTMLVAAGERLAADGFILDGESELDLSLLTGESEPQHCGVDDKILAGTFNLVAPLKIRVTATGADTAIADIARLMGEAAQSKSIYIRVADRAARIYAPAVHTLALLAFIGWMLAGAGWHQSVLISVAVLIITCPCALGLAVPASQIVVAGSLMRAGILVKDGSALERLAEVDLAFFDKTGTLTLGRLEPTNLDAASDQQKSLILALAQSSKHPLSQALYKKLQSENITPALLEEITEEPGFGVRAIWGGRSVSLGRPNGTVTGNMLATNLVVEGEDASTDIFTMEFTDQIRPDAKQAVDALQKLNIQSSIISGDRAEAVAPIARMLGLTAQTSMLPAEKLAAISRQSDAGHKVLMLGDGLNDGPALAAGHASIAPGSASDAGKNAADFIFMGDGLMPVVTAVKAARKTQSVVRQNFALAIGYNIIAVPLAILGFVTPLIAAIAMSGSSLIVVANALRLKRIVH